MSFGLSKADHTKLAKSRHRSAASTFAYVKKMLNNGHCDAAQANLYSAVAQMGMYRAQSESSSMILRGRETAGHDSRIRTRMQSEYQKFWGTVNKLDRQIMACRIRAGGLGSR